ncbi:peroxidase P7 [Cryptomeria japonica]|uniref:peroxidase P7 n=1 Tax=Cryptomeria japonica TaxID=3369 RepID=UPI0027DA3878|nr:peroxidase P7 [Cryptomeria japonica]
MYQSPLQSVMAISNPIACIVLLIISSWCVNGQLSPTFYDKSCPKALSTIKAAVAQAVAKEKRMGASLLRLHFHDCFVNGCDGWILLDDTPTFTGEKTAAPNNNSVRGFEVIDTIKTQVEAVCSGVVSCADILAIAARDSVVELGGPSWTVMLGRRDSTTASKSAANTSIPAPTLNLSALISSFSAQGLSRKDLVALSGSHTIGQARCTSFRARIYNEYQINTSFATSLKANCPSTSGSGDNNLAPLDLQTPTVFENNYYKNLLSQKGLLHSDQQLFIGGSTDLRVKKYSLHQKTFFKDFKAAMVKMGNIKPLTGTKGQIRKNCRKPN